MIGSLFMKVPYSSKILSWFSSCLELVGLGTHLHKSSYVPYARNFAYALLILPYDTLSVWGHRSCSCHWAPLLADKLSSCQPPTDTHFPKCNFLKILWSGSPFMTFRLSVYSLQLKFCWWCKFVAADNLLLFTWVLDLDLAPPPHSMCMRVYLVAALWQLVLSSSSFMPSGGQ